MSVYSYMRILVADDDMAFRNHLHKNLIEMGFCSIDLVATAEEAEIRLKQKEYDIVFLDWMMPGKSGFGLLKQLREDLHYEDTAFVIVSSESRERYVIEAMKAGAICYLIKPISFVSFNDKVSKVVEWVKKKRAKRHSLLKTEVVVLPLSCQLGSNETMIDS